MIEVVLALVLPAGLLGWACLTALVGKADPLEEGLAKIPVALALGCALLGALQYACLALFDRPLVGVEIALLVALLVVAFRRDHLARVRAVGPRWLVAAASVALAVAVALFVVAGLRRFAVTPLGDWDAWAFWNMRARMIGELGPDWRQAYTGLLADLHPAYPPLQSMMVARAWALAGRENDLSPWLIGEAFGLGTVAVAGWTIARARGVLMGLLAALGVATIPFFAIHTGSQYADVPIAFFFAAMVGCLALAEAEGRRGWLALAGVLAGLAALEKNEGGLFAASLAFGWWVAGRARAPWRAWPALLGALPALALLVWFRVAHAPRGGASEDFVSIGGGASAFFDHVWAAAHDAERWRGAARAWGWYGPRFDRGPVPLLFALAGWVVIGRWSGRVAPRALFGAWVGLALHLAVLTLSLVLLSTWSIASHSTSLERLLLQVAPALVVLVFAGVWTRPPKR